MLIDTNPPFRHQADSKAAERRRNPLKYLGGAQLTLARGFDYAGHGLSVPSFARFGPFCVLTGALSLPKKYVGSVLAVLPTKCRPEKELIFEAHMGGEEGVLLDVNSEGELRLMIQRDHPRVFLDGVVIPVASAYGVRLTPNPPWLPYGGHSALPRYYAAGGLCVLSGRLRLQYDDLNMWQDTIVTKLPDECRPRDDGVLIFTVNHHDATQGIKVHPDGRLQYFAGTIKVPWLSLNGIMFFTRSNSQPLELNKFWVARSKGFRIPSYRRSGRLCLLSGVATRLGKLLHDQTSADIIVTKLPEECRPLKRLVFSTNQEQTVRSVSVC